MAVARILAKLGIDISEFQVGVKKAQQSAATFASSNLNQVKTAVAGAFTVGAVIAFADKVTRAANETLDLAKAVGVSTDTIQALTAAAKQSGASQDDVTRALHKLRDSQGEVARGNKAMADSFSELGISAEEVKSLGVEGLLERVASAMKEGGTTSAEYSAAIDVLGKGSLPQLNDVLSQVAEGGLAKFNESMQDATGFLKNPELKNLAEARRQVSAAAGAASNIGAEFLGSAILIGRSLYGALSESTNRALGLSRDRRSVFEVGARNALGTLELPKTTEQKAASEQDILRARTGADRQKVEDAAIAAAQKRQEEERKDRREKSKAEVEAVFDKQYRDEADAAKYKMERMRILHGDGLGGFGAPQAADNLARIGGFIGGQADPMRNAAERQVKIQQELLKLARQVVDSRRLEDLGL